MSIAKAIFINKWKMTPIGKIGKIGLKIKPRNSRSQNQKESQQTTTLGFPNEFLCNTKNKTKMVGLGKKLEHMGEKFSKLEEDKVLGIRKLMKMEEDRGEREGARFWALKGEDLSFKNDLDPMATMQDELGLK